jgi:glycosyltransferase involved in cell wall biosynthesis
MLSNKKIGVLVVAYNAATTLASVLDRISKDVWDEIDEVAVFDDKSHDQTFQLGLEYKILKDIEKLNIYRNEKNLGYGGNQKRGFKYFADKGFDVVVLLHGDGQYAPEMLKQMYDPLIEGRADAVFGSRMMKKFGGPLKGGMPVYKFIGNRVLTVFENFVLGMDLTEFHSGYRAYSLAALNKIRLDNCSDEFHFDTQIIVKLNHQGFKIIEVPIPTFYGEEICYVNGMKYAKDILKTVIEYKKMRFGKKTDITYEEYYDLGR